MSTVDQLLRHLHVAAGSLALLAGAVAMTARKASGPHRAAGHAFLVSMLVMAGLGVAIATFYSPLRGNVLGGLLAFYLTLTGWAAAWRPAHATGPLERGGALLGLVTALCGGTWGVQATLAPSGRLEPHYDAPFYFVFGGIALLATFGDLRVLRRGGVAGVARTTRHLWRIGVAAFIAYASFFIGQARVFPAPVRESGVLRIPVLLVVAVVLYWLVRLRLWPRLRRLRPPVARRLGV
jgi:hypothetical protein